MACSWLPCNVLRRHCRYDLARVPQPIPLHPSNPCCGVPNYQLRAATLRKREEAASRELTRATGQAKVREEELRVLRESKRKQVTRISQLEKQLRTVKADLKATNTAKAWADQTVESLRSRLKALEVRLRDFLGTGRVSSACGVGSSPHAVTA